MLNDVTPKRLDEPMKDTELIQVITLYMFAARPKMSAKFIIPLNNLVEVGNVQDLLAKYVIDAGTARDFYDSHLGLDLKVNY